MRPFRILIVSIAMLALALAIAACGGSSGAQEIVDEATLEGVESGNLDLKLGVDAEGSQGGQFNIAVSGPFEAENGAIAPELDLTATVQGSVGEKQIDFDGGIVLTGNNKAYVEFEGTDYKVDPTTQRFGTEIIGESEEVSACREAVSGRQLSEFIEDPTEEGAVDVGGTSTTKVSGDVDAEAALDALREMNEDALCSEQLKFVPGIGRQLSVLAESKDNSQSSLKDAHFAIYVGDDHIVRRLQARFTIEAPAELGTPGRESAALDIDMTLTDVNEPQEISAPKTSKPLSALFLKLGINPIELLGIARNGIGGAGLINFLERIAAAGGSR